PHYRQRTDRYVALDLAAMTSTASPSSRPHLLPPLQQHLPLQRADAIDKQDAIDMIDLVLQDAREQAFRLDLHRLAMLVHSRDDDADGAIDHLIQARQAQAALLALLRLL